MRPDCQCGGNLICKYGFFYKLWRKLLNKKGVTMIRRAANTVSISGSTTTITATGWCLGWYVTGTPANGQTMMADFEENAHGYVSQVPLESIQFQDGLPATSAIPILD